MTQMIWWSVYRNGKLIDSVPYEKGCNKQYVREGLINHDGYPSDIEVEEE